jgi:hypothetical protein
MACPAIAAVPPQMLYPSPNATNVPVNNFGMLFSSPDGNLAEVWSAPALVTAAGVAAAGGPYTIVPTVAPNYIYTSTVGTPLQSNTTYTVQVVHPPSGGSCAQTQSLGSFTTQ